MKRIFGIFKQRWFLSLIGVIALALVIWFAGPLLAFAGYEPLAGVVARSVSIAVIFLIWGGLRLATFLKQRKANAELADGISESQAPGAQESAEEIATLQDAMQQAMEVLKQARLGGRQGRQQLYQLPWYLIIGPPGSGKTTALVNSGLNFPLAERFGENAIGGVGGTRHCDWWFTDQAVLIDTAGRYTTQDSFREVDSAAWTGFLGLLKKHRRRRPINGVLVAISLIDLMNQSPQEREEHSRAIRTRIQELQDELGIRFPVYVAFTKTDLVAGFVEFFEDLGREARQQVWGMTFPLDDDTHADTPLASFMAEFDALEQRLNERLLARLDDERDQQKRDLIYAFPQQFESLKQIASEFLSEVFQSSRFDDQPLVRGVYFTSGTQEGTPIDRLMGSLAATFNLDRQALAHASGSGRSYFINRLLGEVVFRESELAGANLKLERKRAWLQRGAYGMAILLALLMAAGWTTSYLRNLAYIEDVAAAADNVEQLVAAVPADRSDVVAVLPALNAARDIPGAYGELSDDTPLLLGLGLYQGDKLGSEARNSYTRLLNALLLPRIMVRIESQLRRRSNNLEFLYETLKVYLMLREAEHFDRDTVRTWLALDWEATLKRNVSAVQREQIQAHVDELFASAPAPLPIALDDRLITIVRATLARVPLARRVYGRLKLAGVGKDIPEFTVINAAGPDAQLVFARNSGKALTTGVPGLYTYAGYHKAFTRESVVFATQLAEESWVLGQDQRVTGDPVALKELIDSVRQLYLRDYVQQWQNLIADVRIAPFTSLAQAIEVISVLTGPDSPLRNFLLAVEQETTLDRDDGVLGAAVKQADEKLGTMKEKLAQILGSDTASEEQPGEAPRHGAVVERQFAALNRMTKGQGDGPSPLDRTLASLEELLAFLNSIDSAANRGDAALQAARQQSGSGSDVLKRLSLAAKRMPAPLNNMVASLTSASTNLTMGGVRAHLQSTWKADVLPFCKRALHNRYPLRADSEQDITLEDFGAFFAPGGILDNYFKTYLADFVDTTANPWRWRGSAEASVTRQALAQFRRGQVIREAFFRNAGNSPSVNFEMKPISMDAAIRQFQLTVDGQELVYRHGPIRSTSFQWPGADGPQRVTLSVSPPAPNGRSGITTDGAWAWFRVLDRARIAPSGQPERFTVTFDVGGRKARYELLAASAFNPFGLKEVQRFRCPETL